MTGIRHPHPRPRLPRRDRGDPHHRVPPGRRAAVDAGRRPGSGVRPAQPPAHPRLTRIVSRPGNWSAGGCRRECCKTAVGEHQASDDVELPQPHRGGSLPAPVLAPVPLVLRGDHAVAGQHPVHRRQRRRRDDTALRELVADPPRPHRGFARRTSQTSASTSAARRAMGGIRAARFLLQAVQATVLVPAEPGMHRLPGDTVAAATSVTCAPPLTSSTARYRFSASHSRSAAATGVPPVTPNNDRQTQPHHLGSCQQCLENAPYCSERSTESRGQPVNYVRRPNIAMRPRLSANRRRR
jgi:hypothetical protein